MRSLARPCAHSSVHCLVRHPPSTTDSSENKAKSLPSRAQSRRGCAARWQIGRNSRSGDAVSACVIRPGQQPTPLKLSLVSSGCSLHCSHLPKASLRGHTLGCAHLVETPSRRPHPFPVFWPVYRSVLSGPSMAGPELRGPVRWPRAQATRFCPTWGRGPYRVPVARVSEHGSP